MSRIRIILITFRFAGVPLQTVRHRAHRNIKNLMLRDDVTVAVKEGKIHVYAVKTIGEGLEILSGKNAGEADASGAFRRGTVNHLAAKRPGGLNDSMRGNFQGMLSNGNQG